MRNGSASFLLVSVIPVLALLAFHEGLAEERFADRHFYGSSGVAWGVSAMWIKESQA
ncbi:MAG: hypothetical protein QMB52_05490 [Propionivibrio sp.]